MVIPKRVKCLVCNTIVEVLDGCDSECICKKVVIVEGIVNGIIGKDYIDVSPKLLNE